MRRHDILAAVERVFPGLPPLPMARGAIDSLAFRVAATCNEYDLRLLAQQVCLQEALLAHRRGESTDYLLSLRAR